jgi:lipopolysaccharide transport system permease protein
MTENPASLRVTIKPNQSWVRVDWAGLWHYRDLLLIMVQRDFTSKYKQTILGPIWFFLNPLITTVVFTLVFSRVLGVPTDGVPPMLFYLCGTLGWGYFANVLGGTSNSLAGNAALFGKVYFPRIIPPLVVTISSLFALGIQLLTFLTFYGLHVGRGVRPLLPGPSLAWALFPLVVVHMALLALGVGLILSALTAKYRDLQHLQGFLVQIWMYATPVIYPLSRIPDSYRWLAGINPMTAIVEATRRIFLGAGAVDPGSYALSLGLSAGLFAAGLLLYQHTARSFVDTV